MWAGIWPGLSPHTLLCPISYLSPVTARHHGLHLPSPQVFNYLHHMAEIPLLRQQFVRVQSSLPARSSQLENFQSVNNPREVSPLIDRLSAVTEHKQTSTLLMVHFHLLTDTGPSMRTAATLGLMSCQSELFTWCASDDAICLHFVENEA